MAATKTQERPAPESMQAVKGGAKVRAISPRKKPGKGDAPMCRFCAVELQKHTSTVNFEDLIGGTVTLEGARTHTNFHITKAFRYNNEKDEIYAANFWDGESYGFAGESLFCSKTCGHNFGRVVAEDLPEVQVNIKVR